MTGARGDEGRDHHGVARLRINSKKGEFLAWGIEWKSTKKKGGNNYARIESRIEWESTVILDGSNRSFGGGSRQKFDSFFGRFRLDSRLDFHSIPSRFRTRFLSISTRFPTLKNGNSRILFASQVTAPTTKNGGRRFTMSSV